MTRKQIERLAAFSQVYQLKVTLRGSRPPIWRQLRVLGDTALHSLHQVIQDAMGWTNSHLYHITVDGRRYSERRPDDDIFGAPPMDARRIRLQDFRLGEGDRFTYLYDFGDDWEHEIRIEAVFPAIAGERYPCCTGGARACPPEDVGGIHGYAEFLDALADPQHPQHDELSEWAPEGFDPEAFDAAAVTQHLDRRQRRARGSNRSVPRPEA